MRPMLPLFVLACLLALAPSAHAVVASVNGDTLVLTGGPEANDVDIQFDCDFMSGACSGKLRVHDTAGVTAGAGCSTDADGDTTCGSPAVTLSQIDLGAGDDKYQDIVGLGDQGTGGPGDDRISTGEGRDVVSGGDGNDELSDLGDDGTDPASSGAELDGGPGNDTLDGSAQPTVSDVLEGGPGDDRLTGYQGDDDLDGGGGNDDVAGGEGDDSVAGGEGDDTLDSRALTSVANLGTDVVTGGPGHDEAGYSNRNEPVTASLDDRANDGAPGERDHLRGIEVLVGGSGDDELTGSDGDDELLPGSGGADVMRGLGGDDEISGGSDNDTIDGGPGDDVLNGGSDDDDITGGPGRDTIQGDTNTVNAGNDRIFVRDGVADQVLCGFGADSVQADHLDVLEDIHCEQVDRERVSPPSGGGAVALKGVPQRIKIATLIRKGLRFRIRVGQAGQVTAGLVVPAQAARRAGLGRGQVTVGAVQERVRAGTYRVTIRPTPKMKRKLAGLARRKGFRSLQAVAVGLLGDHTATKPVRLKR